MNLPFLFGAHLIGDFLLQNHWMQAKSRNSFICTIHVLCYAMPFWPIMVRGLVPWWALVLILIEHWVQDRYSLNITWMKLMHQTPPPLWPFGLLCVDQSMHLGFMWVLALLAF